MSGHDRVTNPASWAAPKASARACHFRSAESYSLNAPSTSCARSARSGCTEGPPAHAQPRASTSGVPQQTAPASPAAPPMPTRRMAGAQDRWGQGQWSAGASSSPVKLVTDSDPQRGMLMRPPPRLWLTDGNMARVSTHVVQPSSNSGTSSSDQCASLCGELPIGASSHRCAVSFSTYVAPKRLSTDDEGLPSTALISALI